MKRIVKETLENGKVQYRVEINSFFTFGEWKTDTCYSAEYDCYFKAVFDNLMEAKIHCGIPTEKVIKREILE